MKSSKAEKAKIAGAVIIMLAHLRYVVYPLPLAGMPLALAGLAVAFLVGKAMCKCEKKVEEKEDAV